MDEFSRSCCCAMRNHAPIALLRINEPSDVSTERRSQRHIDGSRNVAILGGPGEGFGAGHPRSAAPAENLSSVTPMSSQAVTIVPRRTQLIAAMWVGFSLLAIGGRRAAAQIGTVSCHDSGNVTTCRIDQPNVTQRSSQYRNVVFRPNDAVVVTAGGCVQTGGVGSDVETLRQPKRSKRRSPLSRSDQRPGQPTRRRARANSDGCRSAPSRSRFESSGEQLPHSRLRG